MVEKGERSRRKIGPASADCSLRLLAFPRDLRRRKLSLVKEIMWRRWWVPLILFSQLSSFLLGQLTWPRTSLDGDTFVMQVHASGREVREQG